MHRGYIKLWRKIEDSFIWQDRDFFYLWAFLLMRAAHKEIEVLQGFKNITLTRGQLKTSIRSLSEETKIPTDKVFRTLKLMESATLIQTQKNNKYTIISIVNYDSYQDNQTQNQIQVKHKSNAGQTHLYNKHLNIKELNKPPLSPFESLKQQHLYLNDEAFENAYRAWLEVRKKKNAAPTLRAQELALKLLHSHPIETAIRMLEQSVLNNYTGIFELKDQKGGGYGQRTVGKDSVADQRAEQLRNLPATEIQ